MHVLAPLRALLARRPLIYWVLVAALAGVVADAAASKFRALDDARRSWGESAEVWVAGESVRPGDPVVATRTSVPRAVVPPGAVRTDPSGSLAVQQVMPGEIVTVADVGNGPLDLVPEGWQGVAFAADDTTVRLGIGDHVSVVADGIVVVDAGIVIDVQERSVTVGVPAADAPSAALASRTQGAALTLRHP